MKDQVMDYDVASCDATTLQVLNESGRKAETKSYVYCIRGGSPDQSVILYAYNEKLHNVFVKDWFEGFNGYLHVDGDNFFELIGEFADLVNCNAHARLEIDNNLTEQQIKPFVIARKNFLFASSVDGANALCMHMSFVRTAKLHGHDPYHYYVQLLKHIPHSQTLEDYEKLLPWNLKSEYIMPK
jgi:hypothetical protein